MSPPKARAPRLAARIRAARHQLSRAELRAALYMRDHPQDVLFESAAKLGSLSETSDATVVRTIQSLGYKGFAELKRELGRELVATVDPSERLHERIERDRGRHKGALDAVFEEAVTRLEQTRDTIRPEAIEAAAEVLDGAAHIYTWGLGASSHEAVYAALRLRRLGLKALSLTSTGFHLSDELLLIGDNDAIVLYVRGRHLNDVEVLVETAHMAGAKIILITGFLGSAFQDSASVVLETSDSREGHTRESVAASMVTDALMLALADRNEARAVATSRKLSEFRRRLMGAKQQTRKPVPDRFREAR